MKKNSHLQTGFTLVEMVIVILIMSALAVTAYARISQIDTQARLAALQSFKASVLSVATMAKGVCLSDAQCQSTHSQGTPSTTIDGNTIYFTYGYPVGWLADNADGSGSLHQLLDPGKFVIQPSLSSLNRATYFLSGARDMAHCKLEYSIAGGTPSVSSITVNIDSSGC